MVEEKNQDQSKKDEKQKKTFDDTIETVKKFAENSEDCTEHFDQSDIENNKVIAGLSYFIFFLPLIFCPNSAYGKFHANQALILLIVSVCGNLVLKLIPFIGWILIPFFGLLIFCFTIFGLINGLNGKAKKLPIIGMYDILK